MVNPPVCTSSLLKMLFKILNNNYFCYLWFFFGGGVSQKSRKNSKDHFVYFSEMPNYSCLLAFLKRKINFGCG